MTTTPRPEWERAHFLILKALRDGLDDVLFSARAMREAEHKRAVEDDSQDDERAAHATAEADARQKAA